MEKNNTSQSSKPSTSSVSSPKGGLLKKILLGPVFFWMGLFRFLKHNLWLVIIFLIFIIGLLGYLLLGNKNIVSVSVGFNKTIELTPQQITSIEEIGEWEFLSIATEEMVDTLRKGMFTTDQLVRIYKGNLRLGINLKETEEHWITSHGDTVSLLLPSVKLLDKDFIDEASTRTFYESGTWSNHDREMMYYRARNRMIRRYLNRENLNTAQQNAQAQLSSLFKSFGFATVEFRSPKE